MNIQHAKITKREALDDGTVKIIHESYYERLAFMSIEIEKKIPVLRGTLLKEVMSALEHLTKDQTPELNLCIKPLADGKYEVVKRWTVEKQHFNKQ
jgi:hypothetical protein